MFRITKVEIQGFWGKYKAITSLYPDVNIFIGWNGSGKTTFMDLLQGVLRVDLRVLVSLDFESITASLKDKAKTRTITVDKRDAGGVPSDAIVFRIGSKNYTLPIYPREFYEDSSFRRNMRNARLEKEYGGLKRQIGELINIVSLSVHKAAYETTYEEEESLPRHRVRRPPIEQRLEGLVRQLTSYQLSLAERANQISTNFQREVLASMLYDEKFDKFDPRDAQGTELGKEKEDLSKAYRELGALNKNVSERIDKHIAALNRSLVALHEFGRREEASEPEGRDRGLLLIDDIMPLPLLNRTQHIIDLSLQAQNRKQEVFQPIARFVQIVGDFMEDKKVRIDPTGDLIIQKDGKKIATADLSSGEKQLLILLIETLLQKNAPFIFLADEPELSLHIEWQAKIVASIKDLNPNSQIIVATHSPEIAGGWKGNVIDMEDIIDAQG